MIMSKPESKPSTDNPLLAGPAHLSGPTPSESAHLSRDSDSEFGSDAHLSDEPLSAFQNAAHLLGGGQGVSPTRRAYQRARLNCFIPPAFRHQLDTLAAEQGTTLSE